MDWSPLIWSLYVTQAYETGYDASGVTVAMLDAGFPRDYDGYLPPGSVDVATPPRSGRSAGARMRRTGRPRR